jgi:hypothetical protein
MKNIKMFYNNKINLFNNQENLKKEFYKITNIQY